MSETKWTAGPWRVGVCPCGNRHCQLFNTSNGLFPAGSGYSEDDARLIAAAPELYAALEDTEFLLRMLAENPGDVGCMIDSLKRSAADAHAALAKARGES